MTVTRGLDDERLTEFYWRNCWPSRSEL